MNTQQLHDILSGRDTSAKGRRARVGLSMLEPFYRAGIALRNAMFDHRLRKPHRLPRPTISVGNLTTGGTGKTPMVAELARRLIAMQHQPAILLRGYMPRAGRGQQPISDEAQLYQLELGDRVPVEANPDRVRGAQQVMARAGDTDVLILDDGFQHRQVHRDLDLVLIDATVPFGFGRVLPRGLLREPAKNLRRADAVIVTRADQVDADELAELDRRVASLHGKPPIAHAAHTWTALVDMDDRKLPLETLRGQPVLGVAGIGNIEAFTRSLKAHAGDSVRVQPFPDHHVFTLEAVRNLREQAGGTHTIVTTEKDWVKLSPHRDALDGCHVFRVRMRIGMLDGSDAVDTLLRNLF